MHILNAHLTQRISDNKHLKQVAVSDTERQDVMFSFFELTTTIIISHAPYRLCYDYFHNALQSLRIFCVCDKAASLIHLTLKIFT